MVILMKPELENVILVQDLCMVMENFGIEEDIDGITDSQANTERENSNKKLTKSDEKPKSSAKESYQQETYGAVDLANDKNKHQKENLNNYRKDVDNDIEEDYGQQDHFDFEPEKPKTKESPKKPLDEDEDNEDLFGNVQEVEPQNHMPRAEESNHEIKDEYDFDIPVDSKHSSKHEKISDKFSDKYSDKYDKKNANSDKVSSKKAKSEKIPSEIDDAHDEIQDDYDSGQDQFEDQGAAKQSSHIEQELDEDIPDDYEQPDNNDQPDDDQPNDYDQPDDNYEDEEQNQDDQNDNDDSDEKDGYTVEKQEDDDEPVQAARPQSGKKSSSSMGKHQESERSGDQKSRSHHDQDEEDDHASKKKKHLRFDLLSDKGLHILYNMTAYIGDNEPEDLFNDFIYEQLIKTRKKQNMVELINADDFFNVLEEHEVIPQTSSEVQKSELEAAKESIKELL